MGKKEGTIMLTSTAHKLFDFVLDILNQNDKGVIFDGNFTWKFWQQPSNKIQDFHILKEGETLEFDAQTVVPFVDISTVEIPFNERNKRQDMELEYYVAIRIERGIDSKGVLVQEFDSTDHRYQALMQGYTNFKDNLTFQDANMRVGFKVREPQKVNVFKYNKHFYQLFALTLNISKIEKGRFGNEMKLYMRKKGAVDWELLDTIESRTVMGKTEQPREKTNDLDQKISIVNRTWETTMTINYLEETVDKQLLEEIEVVNEAINNNQQVFELRKVQVGTFDYTRDVVIVAGSVTYTNNVPETLTFTLKRSGV